MNRGRYDLPKGIKQMGEDDLIAALRELREEAGIEKPQIVPGFKKIKHYFYRWEGTLVSKEVVYFLAEYGQGEIKISEEHDGFSWLTKEEALSKIKYPTLKEVIKEAALFLTAT
jgi:8-oxo-dGTP pyrophosphatase MutT (NUDIX family)